MDWFVNWFNSPYYHILYKSRDTKEAEIFMDNLSEKLSFSPQQQILDLACGKGRHAIYLNKKGFNITGTDLSTESIAYAQKYARLYVNERLRFAVQDMREVFKENYFDIVLNLFTSFGYFDTKQENQQAITAMATNLKANGVLVIDFFNTKKIIKNLVPYAQKTENNIIFNIEKTHENGHIIKKIKFSDKNKDFFFQEKVEAISYEDFLVYFQNAGLSIKNIYGNYALDAWNEDNSDRMIFVLTR